LSVGVSLICHNERENIGPCLDFIYNQTVEPETVVIIDDWSTDDTVDIIKATGYPVHLVELKAPRVFKGVNIAWAIHKSLKTMLEVSQVDYILRMDSDARMNNPRTLEILKAEMEGDPRLGITGAYYGKAMIRHVCDAVRMYRRACLLQVMENNPIPNQQGLYPIAYGHDSLAIFRANYHGWTARPANVEYLDVRPYKRNYWQWYQTGRFRYENGFGLVHEVGSTIRYLRQKPYIMGTLVSFISWALAHITPRNKFEPEYIRFMQREFDQVTMDGIKRLLRGETRTVIF